MTDYSECEICHALYCKDGECDCINIPMHTPNEYKTPPKPELKSCYSAYLWHLLSEEPEQNIKDFKIPTDDVYTKESVDALIEWYEARLK